jgi:PAS domain S-box-containing protein
MSLYPPQAEMDDPQLPPAGVSLDGERRFRMLVENIREGFWISSLHKDEFVYVSPAYEEIWGVGRDVLARDPASFLDRIHPDDRPRVLAALPRQPLGEYDEEYRIVRPDGEVRWVRDRAFPIRDARGEVGQIAGLTEDVTERKRAEEGLLQLAREQAARAEADAARRRVTAQFAVSEILAQAEDFVQAIPQLLQALGEQFEWDLGACWCRARDAEELRCSRVWSTSSVAADDFRAETRARGLAPGEGLPGRVWASGEPVWIDDLAHDPHFPRDGAVLRAGLSSALAFSIQSRGEVFGVIEFYHRRTPGPDPLLTRALRTIGNQIGQFIQQKRAEAAVRASERAHRFLAEASTLLISALDYASTLQNLARLTVPFLADWCIVDVVEGESIRRAATAAADPRREEVLHELERLYPPRWDSPQPAAQALRAGRAVLFPEFSAESLRATVRDAEHLRLLRELDPRTAVAIPLSARGHVIGAVTLAFSESGRRYDDDLLALAEELARRAALAVDNANLYREAELARAEAEAANQAKAQFLASMSHELRTPLNAIGGYTDLMLAGVRGPLNEEQEKDLERIRRNQEHLLRLINTVLSFAKIEAGQLRYDLTDVPLDAVLSPVVELVAPQLEANRLRYEYVPGEPGVRARADAEKFLQIILNLLSNAVKFTAPGGRVRLAWEGRGERVEVRVEDTGRGIAAEKLEAVFEPFVQLDTGYTRASEGTGLGLAISRDLARAMGGELTVESRLGEGSVFVLTLPRGRSAQGAGQP